MPQPCSSGHAAVDRIVPPGQYLMMGDNRDNSEDSRVVGLRAGGESGRQGDPDLVQLGLARSGGPIWSRIGSAIR